MRQKRKMESYNPFEVLGLSENSTEEEIKKRFRELLFKYHPDIQDNKENLEKTKLIINAFKDVLMRRKKDKKVEIKPKKVFKIDIFIQPATEQDVYKIIYELLFNIEKYYYCKIELLENIINFLENINESEFVIDSNLVNMLNGIILFFSERRNNILNKEFYLPQVESYKLIFFDYIKNIFKKKDYISYRVAINLNSNLLIKEILNLISVEKNKNIANEFLGMLIILLLLLEEDIYDKLFSFIKR